MNQYILGELKPYRRRLPHNVLWLVEPRRRMAIVCAFFIAVRLLLNKQSFLVLTNKNYSYETESFHVDANNSIRLSVYHLVQVTMMIADYLKKEIILKVGQSMTLSYGGGECTWSSDQPLIASK